MSTYRLESISIFDLKSTDLRDEAIGEVAEEFGTYPEAYRIHFDDGQVLEAVHYTALDIVVFEHDVYDAKTIHEAIPQALAALEPDAWSLEV